MIPRYRHPMALKQFKGTTLAPWWRRVVAAILDFFISIVYFVPALIAGALLALVNSAVVAVLVGLVILVATVGGLYWLLRQMLWLPGKQGQTPGRRVMKIRVVKEEDGRPIGVGMFFLRGLAHNFDSFILYIGYLLPLFTARRQTLADMCVGSVVVLESRPLGSDDSSFDAAALAEQNAHRSQPVAGFMPPPLHR